MHRGAEKLFESRDYRQIIALANRHEWLSSYSGEVGVALMLERALGIATPNHASWLRTLLLEFHRVTSHLAFLAGFPWALESVSVTLRNERERWVQHLEEFTGARMHAMLTVIGGTSREPGSEWLHFLDELSGSLSRCADEVQTYIAQLPEGIGLLTREQAEAFVVSGPVAAASGVHIDTRQITEGLRYSRMDVPAFPVEPRGDVKTRLQQLLNEVQIACAYVVQASHECQLLIGQPHNVMLPKVVRVPEGHYSQRIETPLGQALWYLVSTGDKTPQRLGLRPASLHTVLALRAVLEGSLYSNAASIIASMPFLTGDAER
jgi:NADH-quinone oxidoreductase subunit D